MNRPTRVDSPKKATNVSLPADLVEEAKRLGINLSQVFERTLAAEVRIARGAQWLDENKHALDWSNNYVATHGLPLAKHRKF